MSKGCGGGGGSQRKGEKKKGGSGRDRGRKVAWATSAGERRGRRLPRGRTTSPPEAKQQGRAPPPPTSLPTSPPTTTKAGEGEEGKERRKVSLELARKVSTLPSASAPAAAGAATAGGDCRSLPLEKDVTNFAMHLVISLKTAHNRQGRRGGEIPLLRLHLPTLRSSFSPLSEKFFPRPPWWLTVRRSGDFVEISSSPFSFSPLASSTTAEKRGKRGRRGCGGH